MKRAFSLIELLLVVAILAMLFGVAIYSSSSVDTKTRYENAKEQLKSYVVYHKYKSLNQQTNNILQINVEENSISSPFEEDLNWLSDFTNEIHIADSSSTNITFNVDGSNDDAYIDIISADGAYSNRLSIMQMGIIKYTQIPNTNDISQDVDAEDSN